MNHTDKLEILADAAKYDASCASSGAPRRDSAGAAGGIGATNGMGICHSHTPDGRCVSLLKILLTNFCIYDCQYCVNRRSSNVPRARFAVDEVKNLRTIKLAMGSIRRKRDEVEAEPRAPAFAPSGQSTQMIVGADASDDQTILSTAQTLYGSYKLKRVYYSAFSPIPHSPGSVPSAPPPLLREHRLYQADFLLRGYGFTAGELMPGAGNLALDVDPKLAWALANRAQFPLDLNRADAALLPRVPGIGIKNAKRLVELRRLRRIRWEDLSRLRCGLKKLAPFVITADYRPPQAEAPSELLRRHLADAPLQMDLWPELQAA